MVLIFVGAVRGFVVLRVDVWECLPLGTSHARVCCLQITKEQNERTEPHSRVGKDSATDPQPPTQILLHTNIENDKTEQQPERVLQSERPLELWYEKRQPKCGYDTSGWSGDEAGIQLDSTNTRLARASRIQCMIKRLILF